MIFRSFEVAALIFSPIVGQMLEKMGRKNSILIGFIILILASIGIACTYFIENDKIFLIASVIARFI